MHQISHHRGLYLTGPEESTAARNIDAIAALVAREDKPVASLAARERNLFTRVVDRVFLYARTYFPPLHVAGAAISATILFIYTWILALTVRLISAGEVRWPDFPAGAVLAVWHGEAPSLLVALRARMPAVPVAIMVARDPRGDCLAWLCRLLGLRVVRGDGEHGGWEALAVLAGQVARGTCAVITADGGGPARKAKAGAAALASATGMPLLAVGADCRPAIYERRKWDAARTPLPFGRMVIAIGNSRSLHLFEEADEVEAARLWLQSALDSASEICRQALASPDRVKQVTVQKK
jgi:lysophospholipid acyltransferase (LPLAT)-like uncharacterized protein